MSAILRQQLLRSLILENVKDKFAKLNRRKRQSKPYVNVTVSCPTFLFPPLAAPSSTLAHGINSEQVK